jgi:DNA ligase (NAD+)
MDAKIREQIKKLQDELDYHRRCYYELDKPIISDTEFDILHDQFLNYQKQYPELIDKVGWRSSNRQYRHHHQMLSLRSDRELLNVFSFFAKISDCISCEPKIDGLAIELVYRDNQLVAASTRGDGKIGEDVLNNVLNIPAIPSECREGYDIEINGEIFLMKADFININRDRADRSLAPYSNMRNAAAGILRSIDDTRYLKTLNFFPYTLYGAHVKDQKECIDWFEKGGFNTLTDYIRSRQSIDSIYKYHQHMLDIRDKLPFEIDGLVFKVESLDVREQLGEGNSHPNWAIAYKFHPDRAYTRLNDIVFQVGKTGIVAPVAILEPIRLRNSLVSRASLANRSIIAAKDIRINDVVAVEMANDVIPYIAEVNLDDRIGKEIPIEFPTHCPTCNHKLSESGPHIICTNAQCSSQIIGKLCSAVSRKGLNIKGLGKALIIKLVENDVIKDVSDIFMLDTPNNVDIMRKLGVGPKIINNICLEIKQARNIDLNKFLFSLSIPDVSVATASKLAEYYGSLTNLIESVVVNGTVDLSNTNQQTLKFINEYFNNSKNTSMINRMITDGGLIVKNYHLDKPKELILVTGSLSIPRNDIEDIIKTLGINLVKNISVSVDFVVAGNNPTKSKLDAAKKLNIPIISEDEFKIRLGLESWKIS